MYTYSMSDGSIVLRLLLLGFGLNLIWEFAHCHLYETCRRRTWAQNVPLLLKMSLKDGFFIVLLYLISATLWQTTVILDRRGAVATFLVLALSFSFVDETLSVKRGRWEYAARMPTIFGVGVSPLLEIAVTGLIAIFLAPAGP